MRDDIRAGNLAIEGAKNFGRFDTFFLPVSEWQPTRGLFWQRMGFSAAPGLAIQQLKERLTHAFDQFIETMLNNRQVGFDDTGWRLKTDQSEPIEAERGEKPTAMWRWFNNATRQIRLADLRIEVENDLGFSVHFHSPGQETNDPQEVCALIATIQAHGCNLGLQTMEKIAPGFGYKKLKRP